MQPLAQRSGPTACFVDQMYTYKKDFHGDSTRADAKIQQPIGVLLSSVAVSEPA